MLALALSDDDWGMLTLELPDGDIQRWCSSTDGALRATLAALERSVVNAVAAVDDDVDDLADSAITPACRALADQAGVRSYQALRIDVPSDGPCPSRCVLSVASGSARARPASLAPALRLVMQQVGALLAPAGRTGVPGNAGSVMHDFKRMFESTPGLYLVLSAPEHRIVAVSDSYLSATMVTREGIVGRRLFDVFPDDPADQDADGVAALSLSLQRVALSGLPDAMGVQRYPIRRAGHAAAGFEPRYWIPVNTPVSDANGELAYIIHSVQDVTDYVLVNRDAAPDWAAPGEGHAADDLALRALELRRLASSLSESEQRFRYVTRATNDVLWDWHMGTDMLWCSRSSLEPIGSALARCARLGEWEACIHPDDRARVGASLRESVRAIQENWSAQYRMRLCDGSERHVLHRSFLVVDAQGQPQRMVGSIVDQTEQKQQEASLRLQAEMLDYATDAILVCDLNNRVLYWNDAAAVRYGWRSEDVIGRALSETICSACSPADFSHAIDQLMRHGDHSGRMLHAGANGQQFTVHVHWILVRREDGTPRAILSVITDLSIQIALEQRVFQAEKLEALGRLTGGIAHDFNNWLTVIIGNAEELVEALDAEPQLSEIARMILMAGERGAQLTRRLLTFARRQPLEPHILVVGPVVRDLRNLIRRSLPDNIDLRIAGDEHDWRIHVDQPQLETAILNLAINARDARPDGGCLTIELSLIDVDCSDAAPDRPLVDGEYVVIAVSDDGHGMPDHVALRAFEPFFTTKDAATGSGLGLSMVYGFVRQSKGDVRVYSEAGHGTLVKMYLPRAAAALAPASAGETHDLALAPGWSVLLVEDDPIVRELILAQLVLLGCVATPAADAAEALALLAGSTSYDVLLTDIVMPGMSGVELAGRARATHPALKVLLSSGYSAEALAHQGRIDRGMPLLHKPYGKRALAQALTRILGSVEDARDG